MRDSNWFLIFAAAMIMVGVYSILRPSSVANWLERQGVRHTDQAAVPQRIKVLGILFILAGAFYVVVAIGRH